MYSNVWVPVVDFSQGVHIIAYFKCKIIPITSAATIPQVINYVVAPL